jgi:glycosyltransferase involved in cell wall biosynthesis
MMREAELQRLGAKGKSVVAVSEFIASLLREQGIGVDAVIPNAVDTNLFCPDPAIIPSDECLFVGRYDYYGKGFDVLKALADRGIKIRCITDRDPGHTGLEWTPFVGQAALPAYYRRSACLIFPSRFEGLQLVPLEAMACGCPVVMSNVGVGPELGTRFPRWVIDGNPSDGIDEYCANIRAVISRRSSLSPQARDYVLQHHTFSRFSAAWAELVNRLLPRAA